ncbi:lytic transglycosylase domain-containing protein [Shewanella sp. 3B26]|jgi:soluble lytic murein transglycosylase-like protein|uniref:Lytic transglycosylase domain-containing protein n=1 Tax=Shewanella zhuhaiensis TaxID=2919576 RepID=A0AAJ1BI04_9GAMM|nr:lytic transglycosylase domain-containing protein [Shewanella zhuhaiensis]MCH4295091.1 lytic transglycosylase domain-containing protein [Shewanella zhuhaiensis]
MSAQRTLLPILLLPALLGSVLAYGAENTDSKAKPKITARYSDQGTSSQTKVYRYEQPNGTTVFSDKAPANGKYEILLFDCYACNPRSKVNWRTIRLNRSYERDILLAAETYALEPALIRAVIHAESNFDPKAISRTGAVGLMQLMPGTAKDMGVRNAFLPQDNILGGSRYLSQMLERFKGNLNHALAAYNAGPTRVEEYRGIPPYPETKAYIERVNILLSRYRNLRT